MGLQTIPFPKAVRAHLAAVELMAERGEITADELASETAQILSDAAPLCGVDDTFSTGPTPAEKNHPLGRRSVWWKVVGAEADVSSMVDAAAERISKLTNIHRLAANDAKLGV